jgi:L-ascorbate peroxidase
MSVMSDRPVATIESALREDLMGCMPLEEAPAFLRLAFHDAGTYDVKTHTGGADGAIHLVAELSRGENAGWSSTCVGLLAEVKERFPEVSWADLVAIGGAAAVAKCGGPVIEVGIGRIDATEPAPEHRLPTSDEGAARLKTHFAGMGLGPRELVALSGGHTLGKANGRPFTRDYLDFSNDYFVRLLGQDHDPETGLLPSDRALLDDPELRPFVELYARDEAAFLRDFADAFRRLTWLGGEAPS